LETGIHLEFADFETILISTWAFMVARMQLSENLMSLTKSSADGRLVSDHRASDRVYRIVQLLGEHETSHGQKLLDRDHGTGFKIAVGMIDSGKILDSFKGNDVPLARIRIKTRATHDIRATGPESCIRIPEFEGNCFTDGFRSENCG
jgi:hypothetical protein